MKNIPKQIMKIFETRSNYKFFSRNNRLKTLKCHLKAILYTHINCIVPVATDDL